MDNEEIVEKQKEVKEEVNEVEEVKEPTEEVEEVPEKKEINFSAALKEKNAKIQELKKELKDKEDLIERLTNMGFGETADTDEVSEQVKKITAELQAKEKELEELKSYKDTHEKDSIVKQAQIDLENELARLEKKYPDFDRIKVMGRVVEVKGKFGTLKDLEDSYKVLKYDQSVLEKKSKEAITEGSSGAGVKPPTDKPKSYDEAAERWLQKNKKGG